MTDQIFHAVFPDLFTKLRSAFPIQQEKCLRMMIDGIDRILIPAMDTAKSRIFPGYAKLRRQIDNRCNPRYDIYRNSCLLTCLRQCLRTTIESHITGQDDRPSAVFRMSFYNLYNFLRSILCKLRFLFRTYFQKAHRSDTGIRLLYLCSCVQSQHIFISHPGADKYCTTSAFAYFITHCDILLVLPFSHLILLFPGFQYIQS